MDVLFRYVFPCPALFNRIHFPFFFTYFGVLKYIYLNPEDLVLFMSKIGDFIQKFYSQLALVTILFLFFLQLIAVFVESIYAQCLLTLSLNENVLAVLFLFAPLALVFFGKKSVSDKVLVIFGIGMICCRLIEPFLGTQLRMIISGVGVACFLMFLPALIQKMKTDNQDDQESRSLKFGLAFAMALGASILFRTLGSSVDLSRYGWYQVIGWGLGALAVLVLINLWIHGQDRSSTDVIAEAGKPKEGKPARLSKIIAIVIGMVSILLLTYSAFASPTVISRWTEGNYILIITLLVLLIAAFSIIMLLKPDLLNRLKIWMVLLWNGLFVLMLVLTIAVHQVSFPANSGDYPILAPATNLIHQIPLIVMLVLSPIILVDFSLLTRELIRRGPNTRTMGGAFAIASIFLLFMILAEIFTTTYDYIPAIGPFFRDMFWFVFLMIGIGVILPTLLIKKGTLVFKNPLKGSNIRRVSLIVIACITFGTILGGVLVTASPPAASPGSTMKVMTYNIQQGYNEFGSWGFDAQLQVIRAEDPDILALEESDIARLSGGNADIVRFIADNLNLYSYYGPKTVVGTFGLALLSKYPIKNATTFYVYSEGEQIACIQAEITVGSTTYNIFVAHPAGPGRVTQQQQMLSQITGKSNVIFLGDFNLEPYEESYNITVTLLNDSWDIAGSQITGQLPVGWISRFPEGRIDFIFVSPGTIVNSCKYFGGSASDHPAASVEIQL